jgi:hypothetical protein
MDLPDYLAARGALATLMAGHQTQHRCTDGAYYSTTQSVNCPTRTAVATILETLLTAQTVVHTACHDDATMYLVAESMSGIPLREVPCPVDTDVRLGWLTMARYGTEALAAALDPALVTP